MTAAKHTPGPWRLDERRSPDGLVARINSSRWDALAEVVVRMDDSDADDPVGLANASLIQAAPDLLALAKRYASECAECGGTGIARDPDTNMGGPCPDCADIRAVLAKAEGTTNV